MRDVGELVSIFRNRTYDVANYMVLNLAFRIVKDTLDYHPIAPLCRNSF